MSNVRKFKRHRFRGLKKLIVIAALLVATYFLIFELFRVNRIVIVGSERYTEEEMKSYLMTERLDSNSLYLWIKYKYREKPNIPFVQDIGIELLDKNTIQVTVYEKLVTGCVKFMGEFMYFDKDGIIVETSSKKEEKIPQVIGLNFTKIALYEQLEIQKQSLFQTILDLTKLISQYDLSVDEISFDSDYNVTLNCGESTVLLGQHDFYDVPLSQLGNILGASGGVAYCYDLSNYTEPGQAFHATKIEPKNP